MTLLLRPYNINEKQMGLLRSGGACDIIIEAV